MNELHAFEIISFSNNALSTNLACLFLRFRFARSPRVINWKVVIIGIKRIIEEDVRCYFER